MQYLGTIDKAKDIINKDFVEKLLGDYQQLINESSKLPYSLISGVPTSLPASDVYSWAKSATKPTYKWSEITSKPTWIGSSKPSYSYSEITGAISTTELQNYLTQNSYINVAEGDNRYLQLSGGTLSSNSRSPLTLKSGSSENHSLLLFNRGSDYWGSIGFNAANSLIFKDTNGANYTIWHSGNDGSGSTLDADLLDGQEGSWYQQNVLGFARYNYTSNTASEHDANSVTDGMLYNYGSPNYWKNAPSEMSYGQILSLSSANNAALMGQLAWDINHNSTSDTTRTLWWRGIQGKDRMSYAKWHQIAFTDSNVASATKLQTARTIWGQSFDGSGNVDGNMIVKGQYVGITLQGTNSYNTGIVFNDYEGNPRWNLSYRGLNASDKDFYIYRFTDDNSYHVAMSLIRFNGNVGIGTASPKSLLDVNGSVWIGAGNYVKGRASLLLNSNKGNPADIIFKNGSTTSGNFGSWAISTRFDSDHRFSIWRGGENGSVASELEVLKLYANGNLLVVGGITMYSDQRKKTILSHVELSLKQIAEAPLIEHYYNGDDKKTTHVGSIAQYWASMNDWFCKLDNEGYYTMEIQNAALASAISIARELDRYETKTDKAIKKLRKRICELEEEVERLKSV